MDLSTEFCLGYVSNDYQKTYKGLYIIYKWVKTMSGIELMFGGMAIFFFVWDYVSTKKKFGRYVLW